MAYWLLKTEPDKYSYADLERDGTTVWDGVNNPLALKHIRTMRFGDLALIYHTDKERRVMGIASVIAAPYPDPQLAEEKRVVVDVQAEAKLQPVALSDIKQDDRFAGFDLIRISRLSVVPVSESHWQYLLVLGEFQIKL